jgi:hypothetical protein
MGGVDFRPAGAPAGATHTTEGGLACAPDSPNVIPRNIKGKPGGVLDLVSLGILSLVWAAAASLTGFLLALLARRVHPGLSLVRLWFFYTVLMAFLVAFVLFLGWF